MREVRDFVIFNFRTDVLKHSRSVSGQANRKHPIESSMDKLDLFPRSAINIPDREIERMQHA